MEQGGALQIEDLLACTTALQPLIPCSIWLQHMLRNTCMQILLAPSLDPLLHSVRPQVGTYERSTQETAKGKPAHLLGCPGHASKNVTQEPALPLSHSRFFYLIPC
ncbi:hypothetical protein MA16_Dca023877 [Dendrobium catenatum]|uniref:Uncharacterized protein n=1 Tax=Dendrobium catenatum TaxID=906689 RepID=A0A2I0XFN0_9ASPA|nr:hypothetical protein MA16_Dca023877 [Dendrobium catenatum]